MSFKMRKQPGSSVSLPDSSRVQFFVDENGNPATKNHLGIVSPAATVDGAPIPLDKQTVDPPGFIAGVRGLLYAKDSGGVVMPFFRADNGDVIPLAVIGGRVFTPRWSDFGIKTGLPGEYWEDGELCNAQYGDSIMLDLSESPQDLVTVNLPLMTASNAGMQINFISVFVTDKKAGKATKTKLENAGGPPYFGEYRGVGGQVKLVPAGGDAIYNAPADGIQRLNYTRAYGAYSGYPSDHAVAGGPWSSTLMADGNGRWVVSAASRFFATRGLSYFQPYGYPL